MRYLFLLTFFLGCDKDSTSPRTEDAATECDCPHPSDTGRELCEFYIDDVSCFDTCFEEEEPDSTPEQTEYYEGFIKVCTDCLVDDDYDDALETYSECTSCFEDCEDESSEGLDCNDYCDFFYCVGPTNTCNADPDHPFCTIDCEGVVGGDDFSCFDDAFQDEDDSDDGGAEMCDECLEDCDGYEEPWEVDSCIDFCNETICVGD